VPITPGTLPAAYAWTAVVLVNRKAALPRKNLPDDILNRHLLNINVAHGQFIEQCFANGDNAVAFYF
jgi:hypothetical protein